MFEQEFWTYTRFREEHIIPIAEELVLPEVIHIGRPKHRISVRRTDALILFLLRFSYPSTLYRLQGWTGWHYSDISRIVKYMVDHIYDRCRT